jgi:hypothetical protein
MVALAHHPEIYRVGQIRLPIAAIVEYARSLLHLSSTHGDAMVALHGARQGPGMASILIIGGAPSVRALIRGTLERDGYSEQSRRWPGATAAPPPP